jgi:hypothetical protein
MHDAASQEAGRRVQSAHIARRRDVSGVVRVRVALPHREPRESHLARAVVVHPQQTACPLKCAASVNSCCSGACHMCIDLTDAASQGAAPQQQSAHIARRRDVSGVVSVRVALPHGEPRESHLVRAVVVLATCALTCMMLPRRYLYVESNQLASLAGVTFPASLE